MPATLTGVQGTNHNDYFKDFEAHSNPSWVYASELFAYDENLEKIIFESEEVKDMLKDEIDDLEELSKRDKKGNVENADSKIDGILDRISKLKSSSIYTKLSYIHDSNNNIDFIEAINEGKVILIKIPAKKFSKNMRNMLDGTN